MKLMPSFPKKAVTLGTMTVLGAGAVIAAPAVQAATYYNLDFNRTLLTKEVVDGLTTTITERGEALDAYQLDGSGQTIGTTLFGTNLSTPNIHRIWESDGVFITADPKGRRNDPLGLFNSNCDPVRDRNNGPSSSPCEQRIGSSWKGDPDLATGPLFGTEPQGNLLIFEENPGDGAPDDTARGGTITFDVSGKGWSLEEIGFVDDISGGLITYTFADDTTDTDTINIPGENELKFYSPARSDEIKKVAVTYYGSGAISGLRFKELPPPKIVEPTAVIGLATFGAVATRLKRKQESSNA